MTVYIIALGTLTRQFFGSLEVVRVWCPYCGEEHLHANTSDRHYAKCPKRNLIYYIRVVHLKTEFISQEGIEILPVV
jgi:hypothetical protein